MLDWLQSLKQFFIRVSYHILIASLTRMALSYNRAIRVRLAISIWYETLMKNCFKDWSQSRSMQTVWLLIKLLHRDQFNHSPRLGNFASDNMTKDFTWLILNSMRHLLTLLQTEQTQIRQLLKELPNQGLLCFLMEMWLDMILLYWTWRVISLFYVQIWKFIYIIIHSGWGLAWIFMKERVVTVKGIADVWKDDI